MVTVLPNVFCSRCDFYASSACPNNFILNCTSGNLSSTRMFVDFNSRGKYGGVGSFCSGQDEYNTLILGQGGSSVFFYFDVWKAFEDGVWSSSVELKVYTVSASPNISDNLVVTLPSGSTTSGINPFSLNTGVCPSTLTFTVTITEAGGVTIT